MAAVPPQIDPAAVRGLLSARSRRRRRARPAYLADEHDRERADLPSGHAGRAIRATRFSTSCATISPSASRSIIRPCRSRSIRTSPARLRPMRWFSRQYGGRSAFESIAATYSGERNFAHRHTDPRRSFREAPIERAERRSVVGADRQMKGVACAKIELGLVGKPRAPRESLPAPPEGSEDFRRTCV